MSCRIDSPSTPLTWGLWAVLFWAALDLSLTLTGLSVLSGVSESNPFFVWFTEQGVGWMFVGIGIYVSILVLWYVSMPHAVRAVTTGFLVSIHVYASIGWLEEWFETLDVFFGSWFELVIPAFLGAVFTFLALVDLRSCGPSRLEVHR